jgi:DNA processing protein
MEKLLALALSFKKGYGYKRVKKLLEKFGSLEEGIRELDLNLDPEIERAERELQKARELGVEVRAFFEPEYPKELLKVEQPPIVLYIKGSLKSSPKVAVVGSRKCSDYGRRTAYRLGKLLSEAGITVVSGLALGIDSSAHRGALKASGGTVAVLGSGIDRVYPESNSHLAELIVKSGGALVSEFPLGMRARREHFPRRNRIVAGLSLAVVVVEARERSGTFITVNYALEQGKEVFAVPGPIDSPFSRGSNLLLKEGATPLTSLEEILDFLNYSPPKREPNEFKELYLALSQGAKTVDSLSQELGLDVAQLLKALTLLEVKGFVRRRGALWEAC